MWIQTTEMKLEEYKATYLSFDFDLQLCLYTFSPTYQQRTRRIGVDEQVRPTKQSSSVSLFFKIR
ncbi:hypothetical protein NC652_022281 [Populus alba x Populus x berolinensis]|nr:hypothetical protein NC652_022281 [Populus alba x Populus x berolinensis]